MGATDSLAAVADLLQAPVATSVSGKGVISESHPLAVGWGYGPHASAVAEAIFKKDHLHPLHSGIDLLLAIGVKFSEVSTGYYGNPRPKHVIHVDANPDNLGKVMPADVCVASDADSSSINSSPVRTASAGRRINSWPSAFRSRRRSRNRSWAM